MKKNGNKIKIIFVLFALVIIFFAVYFFQSSKNAKTLIDTTPTTIIGSIPTNNSSGASLFDPITITFNRRIDPSTITISSMPTEDWTTSQEVSNILIANHKIALRVATSYKLTITQNKTVVGMFSFETAHEQNDPRMLQNLQSEFDINYPLSTLVPYETPDFRVVYSAPLTFKIFIKSSIPPQDAISKVKSWVKSYNTDPESHKYIISN